MESGSSSLRDIWHPNAGGLGLFKIKKNQLTKCEAGYEDSLSGSHYLGDFSKQQTQKIGAKASIGHRGIYKDTGASPVQAIGVEGL